MVNAFWLDEDLVQTARWLVDRHVTSSVLENATVLTTAVQVNGYPRGRGPVLQSRGPPAHALGDSEPRELATAQGVHGGRPRRVALPLGPLGRREPRLLGGRELAGRRRRGRSRLAHRIGPDPPQVTGAWSADHYVDAYRFYYANEKRHLFGWAKDRTEPPWIDEYTVDSPTQAE